MVFNVIEQVTGTVQVIKGVDGDHLLLLNPGGKDTAPRVDGHGRHVVVQAHIARSDIDNGLIGHSDVVHPHSSFGIASRQKGLISTILQFGIKDRRALKVVQFNDRLPSLKVKINMI